MKTIAQDSRGHHGDREVKPSEIDYEDDRDDSPVEFTESESRGVVCRNHHGVVDWYNELLDRWAEEYDDLDGAPESDDDR